MATSSAQAPSARLQRTERDHDLDLVEAAIALVARGGASRAALVLNHAELILPAAQASGRRCGVVVRGAWHAGGGCDIVVEPFA